MKPGASMGDSGGKLLKKITKKMVTDGGIDKQATANASLQRRQTVAIPTQDEGMGQTKNVTIPGGTGTIKINKPKLKPVGVAAKDDRIIKLESPTSISM